MQVRAWLHLIYRWENGDLYQRHPIVCPLYTRFPGVIAATETLPLRWRQDLPANRYEAGWIMTLALLGGREVASDIDSLTPASSTCLLESYRAFVLSALQPLGEGGTSTCEAITKVISC